MSFLDFPPFSSSSIGAKSILDTTLRDGEQGVGIALGVQEKVFVYQRLYELGVRRFELGTPIMGGEELEALIEICTFQDESEKSVWCRARVEDVEAACGTGADVIHVSFPTSERQRRIWGWSKHEVLDMLRVLGHQVLGAGRGFSVGAQDASREDRSFLKEFVRSAVHCGAFRLRLADTVGCWSPLVLKELLEDLSEDSICRKISLDVHAHNDLGMATANALTALQSGADTVNVTCGGVGERAGNAALEELVMGMSFSGFDLSGFRKELLEPVVRQVMAVMNRDVPSFKPVIGDSIHAHESGIHCAGLLMDRKSYSLFQPEEVGASVSTSFVDGKHSGKTRSGCLQALEKSVFV